MPFLETTVLAKRWLKDELYGVNAMIKTVSLIEGHREPPPVAVYAEDDDAELFESEDREPPKKPAVLVLTDGDLDEEMGLRGRHPGLVIDGTIALVYASDVELPPLIARRDADYTLRAIVKSMNLWKLSAPSDRELNGVLVADILRVRWMKAEGSAGRARLEGVAMVDVQLLDKQP